jgi:hypothetical protein
LTVAFVSEAETTMERVLPQPAEGRRMSIFTEVGLVDEDRIREERRAVKTTGGPLISMRPVKMLRFKSRNDIFNAEGRRLDDDEDDWESVCDEDEPSGSSQSTTIASSQFFTPTKLYRLGLFSLVLALMLPIIQLNPLKHVGVMGASIAASSIEANVQHSTLVKREDSPTDVCKRYSGQSTIVNGTLYMYGFRSVSDAQQKTNTWSKSTNLHTLPFLRRTRTNSNSQRLPHPRPHQIMASQLAIPNWSP